MRIKYIFLLLLLNAFGSGLMAQTGIIRGTVTDKKTKETLVGVNVYIEGTTIGASTDLNGEYTINNVKAGTYRVVFSLISYRKTILDNVTVSKDMVSQLDLQLEEEAITMQEVEIVDRRTTNSEISIINSIKNTNLVANGISSQQILKSQDRDASEVVRRIPGITIMNGRFIVVRGLNQRYNNVYLNNASTPSSEADTRAFSFDVIPSSLIENIMVYKSPSPELPADFSGAFIEVATRNSPSKNSVDISYSASFREGTSLKEFYSYKGGSLDFLGVDDGTRALPAGFPSTDEFKPLSNTYTPEAQDEVKRLGQEINNTWTAQSHTALLDNRLNIAVANKFRIGKTLAGNITAINYSNTFLNLPIHRIDYQVYNWEEDKPTLNFDFHDQQYTNTAKTGILFNWSFILNPKNKIVFQNLFNQIGFTQTTLREGIEYYSTQQVRSYEYTFMSRTTYSGQLGGEHEFTSLSSKLKWTAGYSYADRSMPDQKRLTTILNTTTGDPWYSYYGVAFGNVASPKYAGIIYQDLKENIGMVKADYVQPLTMGSFKPEIRAGIYGEYRTRTFEARLLGFVKSNENLFNTDLGYESFDLIFQDQNINQTNGIKLAETTNPSDSYDANNVQAAGYVSFKIPIIKRLALYAGIRLEENRQQLNSFSSDLSTEPIHYNNDQLNIFPSANLTFDINAKSLIRFAYGRTINRPEFREIAPFNFYIFQENASFVGNPGLEDAIVQNLDARYELYPTLSEMLSLAVFYKNFQHPIEITYINSGSGLAYGPINASSAYSLGIELEIRKSFQSWGERTDFLRWFRNFSLVLNASYIKSQVYFPENAIARDRYMQGQSPYIINAGLFYSHEKYGFSGSILYNVMGKRIIMVGQAMQNPAEDIPDVYEMPLNSLDLTLSKKIGKKTQLKGGIQNILNQQVRYEQTFISGSSAGGGELVRPEPTLLFRGGRYYTLGVSFSF